MKKLLAVVLLVAMMLFMTACGGEKKPAEAKNVNLPEVLAKFAFDGEMLELDATNLLNLYGIAEADMKQYAATVNSSGIDCDEVILIEAVDDAAAARVKEKLDARYQAKLVETENYLPDEYAIIKECQVTVDGRFVAMIVAPGAADMVKIYNEAVK